MTAIALSDHGPRPPATLLAPADKAPSEKNLLAAAERLAIIQPAIDRMDSEKIGAHSAAQWLFKLRGVKKPSKATLGRWIELYAPSRQLTALAPEYNGQPRQNYGFEVRVWQLYQKATRPSRATVARWAQEEGASEATLSRVNYFLKHLPKNITDCSARRVGKNHHANEIAPYKTRDYENLGVGEEWVSDGHKLKVICRNAVTNDLYRLELTPVIDVRSNYLISWFWSKAESAEGVVYAFCSGLRAMQNVPVWFYTDNGSGFVSHRVQALLKQLGIRHIRGIPGNKKGRGFGEGFHRITTERFARRYEDAFCGEDRTDDAIERIRSKSRKGLVKIPLDVEVMDDFRRYAPHYNATAMSRGSKLQGKAPADFLPHWVQNPLHIPVEQLLRPWADKNPTVQRSVIRFENRRYQAGFLAEHERQEVRLQFDRYDERVVWIYSLSDRFIGEAPIVGKVHNIQESVAADDRERSRLAANARLQIKMDRNNDNYRPVFDSAAVEVSSISTLDQGHCLPAPVVPRVQAPLAAPALDSRTAEILADLSTPSPSPKRASRPLSTEDEIAIRFARAQHIEQQLATGGETEQADLDWLNRYRNTAEYRGQMRFVQAFNQSNRSEHGQG